MERLGFGADSNYQILPDLSVDVRNCWISEDVESLPVQFNQVDWFAWNSNSATSLRGCPRSVANDFDVGSTSITTLEYGPRIVGGVYNVGGTNLKTLNWLPKQAHTFHITSTNIASLHGAEKIFKNTNIAVVEVDQTHLLGLALVPSIQNVRFWNTRVFQWYTFDISHHDPFQFQEQLLEHGLTEQAQL